MIPARNRKEYDFYTSSVIFNTWNFFSVINLCCSVWVLLFLLCSVFLNRRQMERFAIGISNQNSNPAVLLIHKFLPLAWLLLFSLFCLLFEKVHVEQFSFLPQFCGALVITMFCDNDFMCSWAEHGALLMVECFCTFGDNHWVGSEVITCIVFEVLVTPFVAMVTSL